MQTIKEKIENLKLCSSGFSYSIEQMKEDLLIEYSFVDAETFEFAYKWGAKAFIVEEYSAVECFKAQLMNILECFMDLLLLQG